MGCKFGSGNEVLGQCRRVIIERARVRRLVWGAARDVAQVRALVCGGYDVVLGVDVVYVEEALPALLRTAHDLLKEHPLVSSTSPLVSSATSLTRVSPFKNSSALM